MKKILTSSFSIVMAVVILASSSGLFLNKMVCLMSGKSYISFTPIEQCPIDENANIEQGCCDFSQLMLKLNINAHTQQVSLKHIPVYIPAMVQLISNLLPDLQVNELPVTTFADLPPPRTVSSYLSLIQVYII